MAISKEKLIDISKDARFQPNITEKVLHLFAFLNEMNEHPELKGKFALKGGTALNLFVFQAPRLSIDIDLNYVGSAEEDELKRDREAIRKAVPEVCRHLGLNCQLGSDVHAGMKFIATYRSALGGNDQIQIDMNFMYRRPLWPIRILNSHPLGLHTAKNVRVLDECELFAGKLRALLARSRSRDLFDASNLFPAVSDPAKLRLALHIYGAMNAKDWRTVNSANISFNKKELTEQLVPVLKNTPSGLNISSWAAELVTACKESLKGYFPMTAAEIAFVTNIRDKGEIVPAHLTDDKELAAVLLSHPSLLWRCSKAERGED